MNEVSHLSTGKLLVPKYPVGVHVPTCFIPTVQDDYVLHLTGYVWLILSNFLGHTRSWGGGGGWKDKKTAEIINKIMYKFK